MQKRATKIMLLPALLALFGLYACAHKASMALQHPMEVTGAPLCSECHTDGRSSMDHTADFINHHRFSAEQQSRTCNLCHKESFCSSCHGHNGEMKPSDRFKDSPELTLPHRGDYLNQHKIDGRINPAACMKCHGRSNNVRCGVCHR